MVIQTTWITPKQRNVWTFPTITENSEAGSMGSLSFLATLGWMKLWVLPPINENLNWISFDSTCKSKGSRM